MSPVSEEALRSVMRRVPTAVTIVTANTGEDIRGMTVGSFTSVSLEPPLVSFNVGKTANMHAVLIDADYFYVHVLAENQAHLSNHFARPDLSGDAQFRGVPHQMSADGAPILTETLAFLRCEKIVVYDAGDHCLMIGRVDEIVEQREGRPLLYFDRGYRGIGDSVPTLEPIDSPSEA